MDIYALNVTQVFQELIRRYCLDPGLIEIEITESAYETIALYIQKYVQYRKRKVFFGATGKFADLVPSIVKHNTEKYLVPMSDVHNDEIKTLLDKNKIQHTEVVMYRTVSNDFTPEDRVGTIAQSGCPGKQEQCSADGRHNTGSKLHGRNQQKPFS